MTVVGRIEKCSINLCCMGSHKNKTLFVLAVGCYTISLTLSFMKIYIFQAYPVYETEEEIPGVMDQIRNAIKFNYR